MTTRSKIEDILSINSNYVFLHNYIHSMTSQTSILELKTCPFALKYAFRENMFSTYVLSKLVVPPFTYEMCKVRCTRQA